MNSLQLYQDIYKNVAFIHGKASLMKLNELVHKIISEIMTEPYEMINSPFIKETVQLIKIVEGGQAFYTQTTRIYLYDAYFVVKALSEKIINVNFTVATREYTKYADYIFKGMRFQGNQINEINEINTWLKAVQQYVEKQKENLISTKKNPYEKNPLENTQILLSEGDFHKAEVDTKVKTKFCEKMTLGISNTKSADRSNNCRMNIKQWHDETAGIQQKLNELQPVVGDILQKIMNFSNELTEGYILQFAKMQIELYNLIADNLAYHLQNISAGDNKDYVNAISNYQEFMDMIVDNLSAFGIEEISSQAGLRFDGNIHEVIGDSDFSPRLASVKQSERSGFKYNDIIIQKEKIRL